MATTGRVLITDTNGLKIFQNPDGSVEVESSGGQPVGIISTVAHSDTTGRTANDHHAEAHAFWSNKHTGITGTAPMTAVAAVAGTTPAGGVGATEGAYDTAEHRDALIATVAEIKAQLNTLLAELRTAGFLTA
jgi:phage-related minor tail protein